MLAREEVVDHRDGISRIENEFSDTLMSKVGENTVNCAYGFDCAPRAWGHTEYLSEGFDVLTIGDVSEELKNPTFDAIKNMNGVVRKSAHWFVKNNIKDFITSLKAFVEKDHTAVLKKYRHNGKILHYYKDAKGKDAGPLLLSDNGQSDKTKADPNEFAYYRFGWDGYQKPKGRLVSTLKEDHKYFPDAFVAYFSKEQDDEDDEGFEASMTSLSNDFFLSFG